ncbi:MAG: hypothetical protein ACNA70_09755, partial [Brevefilum sp.]
TTRPHQLQGIPRRWWVTAPPPSPARADLMSPQQTPMRHTPQRLLLITLCLLILGLVSGCQSDRAGEMIETATITLTPTITHTATITPTFTSTHTTTPAFTITSPPTNTPTRTPTPFRTLSPTPTPTLAPLRPAALFPYQDNFGRTVDWSYFHVTQLGYNFLGEVNDLWAFMAFQLLDRGIHQRNFYFQGETITVYYLNVAHEFNGELQPMQLVLGGTPGDNVPIASIPAGGTAYVQVAVRDASTRFSPRVVHAEANSAFEDRNEAYPFLFLKDLQALLPELPDELILLANHPILFPRNDWPQVKLDMERVSYLAAQYQPFVELDPYDRLVDQSAFAFALRDHLLDSAPVPPGIYAFSSRNLIIITGE